MSLIITGRKGSPLGGKAEIRTPSDGYRCLAAAVLLSAVKENAFDFLLSAAAETYFSLLDINPDAALEAIRRNYDNGAR